MTTTAKQNEAEFEAFWRGWQKAFVTYDSRALARAAWFAGRLALCERLIAERRQQRASELAELGV